MKPILKTEPELLLVFRPEQKTPVSVCVSLKKIYTLVYILAFTFIGLSLTSLLFFRELEKNRTLVQEILALKVEKQAPIVPLTLPPPAPSAEKAVTETKTIPATSPSTPVTTRLTDFEASCEAGKCTTTVSLVPSQAGVAEGEMLILLETEMLRIGAGGTETQARKQYLAYPEQAVSGEMNEALLSNLKRKPFRFSRALQTTATFTPKNSERPIATHVYVYNADGELTFHDRKPLELEDATH